MRKKVMLGMSGGVDSSVAAVILMKSGFDVTGVTLKLRHSKDETLENINSCCSTDDVNDARRVAYKLGIDHIVMNFTDLFTEKVINNFVHEYLNGRTPNPCIACNKYIKFKAMLDRAHILGFDYIATGHYANKEYSSAKGRYLLKKSRSSKDQSYVLYNLTQDQLKHTLFPLGDMEKNQIRKIATEYSLITADKPDSQEICFVPNNNHADFIKNYTGKDCIPGKFIDSEGNLLGTHNGIIKYTIGQRRGLGIAFGKHMYITEINPNNNTITLGDKSQIYTKTIVASNLNFISIESLKTEIRAQVKTRYKSHPAPAVIKPLEPDKVKIIFDTEQKISAPGQSAVFYDNDIVIGGGIIL